MKIIIAVMLLLPGTLLAQSTSAPIETPQVYAEHQDALPQAVPARPHKSGADRFAELYLFQIFGGLALLTAVSQIVSMRVPRSAYGLRLTWNWLLLVSFLICAFSGFILLFPLDKEMKNAAFHIHIWMGALAAWAGVYHSILRARALLFRETPCK